MAYIEYKFNPTEAKTYKGYKYYKFNDCYIIFNGNMKVKRFSLHKVKEYINSIKEGN